MNKLDPWFVTGFVEGEGAFTYCNGRPVFGLRQRFDYEDVVQALAAFFGVGTVYPCRAKGKSRASAYYRINRLRDLEVVIDHFQRYPLVSAKKRVVFEAWRDLVHFKRLGRLVQKRNQEKHQNLLNALTAMNCRGRSKSVYASNCGVFRSTM